MPERTNPRHPSFGYRTPAAYFVTICTHDRQCLFGQVRRGRMCLNEYGQIVVAEWTRLEALRDEVVLDAFIVMPISTAGRFTKRSGVNHMHGIVCLVPGNVEDVFPRGYDLRAGPSTFGDDHVRGKAADAQQEESRNGPSEESLSSMIGGVKAAVTTRTREAHSDSDVSVWQSRYYDRILRNEREWRACRKYIARNPGRWGHDRHHPQG